MPYRPIRAISIAALALAALAACRGSDDRQASIIDTGGSAIVGGDVMTPPYNPRTEAMSDAAILATVESSNNAEIAAGEMAADSAHDPEVKRYAKMIAYEHREMDRDADRVAGTLNIHSQPTPGESVRGPLDPGLAVLLSGKKGRDFDVAFLDAMIQAHETSLQTLDTAADATNTPQVDSTLARARTKVQGHLEKARELRGKLGP